MLNLFFFHSPLLAETPGPVTNIICETLGNGSINVSWKEPKGPNGAILLYEVTLISCESNEIIQIVNSNKTDVVLNVVLNNSHHGKVIFIK